MTLIFDPAKKVLYAADAGHGFATARKQIVTAPRTPAREAGTQPQAWQPPR